MRFARFRALARFVFAAPACVLAAACQTSSSPGPPSDDPCDVPGTICTIAGTGLAAFDGNLRPALETSIYNPLDLAFDRDGRLLILDFNNWKLRRLNDDGTLEIIMGLDYEGPPVDGALALETPLHHCADIESDAEGRLYLGGNHSPVAFRVDLDDHVDIVAGDLEFALAPFEGDGGPALQARFGAPFGVLPDDRGGLYVSDSDYECVRYIDADGMISTVIGTGVPGYSGDGAPATEAQINEPGRMRLDAEGRLLLCDRNNNAIRRLNPDGTIETWIGQGTAGYLGDGGAAAAALLSRPYDLRFDAGGDLFIADTGNHVIRRVDADEVITTVAGTGEAGFTGDEGPALHCQLDSPAGLIFGDDGSLFIADAYNNRVRKVARLVEYLRDAP